MHSYFTAGTFGSNWSKFTNEISLMALYETLVDIIHFTSSSPPIYFHGILINTQPFKQLRPKLYEFQVSESNKDTADLIFTFSLSMKKLLPAKTLCN